MNWRTICWQSLWPRLADRQALRGAAAAGCLLTALTGCGGSAATATLQVAAQGVFAGALDASGRFALVGSMNHGASLWRLTDGERLYDWKHAAEGYAELAAAGLSHDGRYAVTAEPRNLILWDIASGESIGYWGSPGSILSAAAASDGRRVLLGMDDHSALLFDAQSGDYLATLQHAGPVYSVALNGDERRALTTSEDHSAVLWQLPDGVELQRFATDNPVRQGALAMAAPLAFTATQAGRLVLWDTEQGREQRVLAERAPGVTRARFVRNDGQLLVGYANGVLEVYSTRNGQRLARLQAPLRRPFRASGNALLALAWQQDRQRYLTLVGDGQIHSFSGR